jgi:hypothetical protein
MLGEAGYARLPADLYQTEKWVTRALCHMVALPSVVWEPACGEGRMSAVLAEYTSVVSTDLHPHGYGGCGVDFLNTDVWPVGCGAIVTNPPYSNGMAERFVRRALEIAMPRRAMVAMLLRHEWDCAVERRDLFDRCPHYAAKITLLKRPRWIDGTTESPRFPFAWFIWRPDHRGVPAALYCHPSDLPDQAAP